MPLMKKCGLRSRLAFCMHAFFNNATFVHTYTVILYSGTSVNNHLWIKASCYITARAPRSQMNSLCTKQPLNKGYLCIKAKTLFPKGDRYRGVPLCNVCFCKLASGIMALQNKIEKTDTMQYLYGITILCLIAKLNHQVAKFIFYWFGSICKCFHLH